MEDVTRHSRDAYRLPCIFVAAVSSTHEAPLQSTLYNQLEKVKPMNKFLTIANNSIRSFAKDEDGAQVVEYALIIAVVSIALVIALSALTANGGGFATFITRGAAGRAAAAGAGGAAAGW